MELKNLVKEKDKIFNLNILSNENIKNNLINCKNYFSYLFNIYNIIVYDSRRT